MLKAPKERLLSIPDGSEHVLINIGPSHPAMHGPSEALDQINAALMK